MKIMYLCSKHPPFDGRVHYKVSASLVKSNHELINIHPNIVESTDNGISLKSFDQKYGLLGRVTSYFSLYKVAKKNHPDIIIAPEPDSLVVAYFFKKFSNVKVVFDCHEWYNLHFTHVMKIKNKVFGKTLNSIVSFVIAFVSKRIDAILTVNDTMTKFYSKYNENTHTIPSLMDQSYVATFNVSRHSFYYFGQFGNGGQVDIILDAARILKQKSSVAKIIVLGGYRSEEHEKQIEIKEIIRNEELHQNLEILDWLPKNEAFKLLNTGLVGIMRFDTNYYNGLPALPNKIFEYMSLGLAIICCRLNSELTSIVDSEKCGVIIENESGLDLAEAILYLHSNPEICENYGENSLRAIREKYNWDYYGNKLNEIMEDLGSN